MCFGRFRLFRKKNVVDFTKNFRPKIDFYKYLEIIYRNFNYNNSLMVISIIYLKKINYSHPNVINSLNIHQFFLISVIISEKYLEDNIKPFDFISSQLGLTKKELIQLECKFIQLINWDLHVNTNEYLKVFDIIIENAMINDIQSFYNTNDFKYVYILNSIYNYIKISLLS